MLGLLPEDVGLLSSPSDPRVSPDGARVAYTVQRVDADHNRYQGRVWVGVTDGTTPAAAISPDDVTAGLARWSPDGTRLAYAAHAVDDSDDHAVSEIRVVAATGGDHTVVCTCPTGPTEIEWSPDGSRILFRSDRGGKVGIWWQPSDGRAAAELLYEPAEPFKKDAAIAKLASSDAAMVNAREATQIFGGYGYMNETPVGRFYRDAKILEIGEGTSEVLRGLIARELGLPAYTT